MASFDFDQAEGLRRMLAGPKPRIVTMLSAAGREEKNAVLVNVAFSLARSGNDVLLLDASTSMALDGIAPHLGLEPGMGRCATLLEVARQERALNEAVQAMPHGFRVAMLARGPVRAVKDDALTRRLSNTFNMLAKQSEIVLIDGELGYEDAFPVPAMANEEIMVQVSASAASIKSAYAAIKRLHGWLGKRSFGVLVTGAPDKEAKVVFENMARVAKSYLAVQLHSMGSVPADEHVQRAARLGRPVVDAFPLAGVSVALRRLAGRFAPAEELCQ